MKSLLIALGLVLIGQNCLNASPINKAVESREELEKSGVSYSSTVTDGQCIVTIESMVHSLRVEFSESENGISFVNCGGSESPKTTDKTVHEISIGFPVKNADKVSITVLVSSDENWVVSGSDLAFDFKKRDPFEK